MVEKKNNLKQHIARITGNNYGSAKIITALSKINVFCSEDLDYIKEA
jgi:hypothetical protein